MRKYQYGTELYDKTYNRKDDMPKCFVCEEDAYCAVPPAYVSGHEDMRCHRLNLCAPCAEDDGLDPDEWPLW